MHNIIYAIPISNLILILFHFLKIYEYGVYSKITVSLISTTCIILQFMILPIDATNYKITEIFKYYFIAIIVSFISIEILTHIFHNKYNRWIRINRYIFNKKNPDKIYFVNKTNDIIICFLMPIIGLTISLLWSML